MSDGLSDYWASVLRPDSVNYDPQDGWHGGVGPRWPYDRPIVPRTVTEYGRMMWAEDLGLGEKQPEVSIWDRYVCHTRNGRKVVLNNLSGWRRGDFKFLGVIEPSDHSPLTRGDTFGWAWHADGRSIDRDDRAFDLVDLPAWAVETQDEPAYFWLGRDAEAA